MRAYFPGVVLVGLITLLSFLLVEWGIATDLGLRSMSFALLIGMLLGNTIYARFSTQADKGVYFAKSTLLRLGIVLYGLRLTLVQMADLGWSIILVDILIVFSTFWVSYFFGIYLLKMERNTVILTGAGCSICGASAIMATSSILKAKASEITQAIAVIVLFGTVALFLYPWIYHTWFAPQQALDFGVIVGASVHEVAQVVAIARQVGEGAMDLAILTKMVRVMMLVPFLFILVLCLSRGQTQGVQKMTIPWFAIGFLVLIVLNSLIDIPDGLKQGALGLGQVVLTMAMAALGLSTQFATVRKAGAKAFILGLLTFVWLIFAGFATYALLA